MEKMMESDPLKDGPVNNFAGSMNLSDNLKLVPSEMLMDAVSRDFSSRYLFAGLDKAAGAVPECFWELTEVMVRKRVRHVKEICDQR